MELIEREQLMSDARLAQTLRLSQHAGQRNFQETLNKLREHGG